MNRDTLYFNTYFAVQNTPKYKIAFRECAKSLQVYKDNTAILEWFLMYEVVFEYAKSSLACTENTLNEYKRL